MRSFQRTYGREVHDGPHSNLLWAGRMPERWTHSLIKVSGEKNDMRKVSYQKIGKTWRQDLETAQCGSAYPLCLSL